MADTLSPSEFEFLMALPNVPEGGSASAAPATVRNTPHVEVCAPGLSRESGRVLHLMHERHAVISGAALGKLLRTNVEATLVSLEEIPGSELQTLLENPSCCFLAEVAPLTGLLLLEIGPALGLVLVDRLLGGAEPQLPVTPCRPLTAIECRLLSRVATAIFDALCEAWRELSVQQPRIVRTESDSRLAAVAVSDESALVATFELAVGEARGAWRLLFSRRSLLPILPPLHASSGDSAAIIAAASANSIESAAGSESGRVPIVVQLAGARLTESELRELSVGDIIVTDNSPAAPAQVFADGRCRFTGHPGQFNGRKAVRIGDAHAGELGPDDASGRDVAAREGGGE